MLNEVQLAYLGVFLLALAVSFLFVPWARRLSIKLDIVDKPGGRKTHREAIPCLGGLAVYLAFVLDVVGGLTAFYFLNRLQLSHQFLPELAKEIPLLRKTAPKLFSVLGGATIMLILGLVDDVIGVRFDYRAKFTAQLLVAFWMSVVGIRHSLIGIPLLDTVMTVLWIVGITNAFNLLDNMDGLSGGVAFICCILFFFICARQDQIFVGMLYLALAGATLGFLYFNFSPARIFLGDTGALFLGFTLATTTVLQSYITPTSTGMFPVLMPVIILAVPIFDTTRVILIRLFEKRPIFQGDRRHLSHRLVDMGLSVREAVVAVYLLTFSLGLGCIVLDSADLFTNWIIIAQAAFMAITISVI